MVEVFLDRGCMVSGGTDNHLFLLIWRCSTGKEADAALGRATVNKKHTE